MNSPFNSNDHPDDRPNWIKINSNTTSGSKRDKPLDKQFKIDSIYTLLELNASRGNFLRSHTIALSRLYNQHLRTAFVLRNATRLGPIVTELRSTSGWYRARTRTEIEPSAMRKESSFLATRVQSERTQHLLTHPTRAFTAYVAMIHSGWPDWAPRKNGNTLNQTLDDDRRHFCGREFSTRPCSRSQLLFLENPVHKDTRLRPISLTTTYDNYRVDWLSAEWRRANLPNEGTDTLYP